MYVRVRGFGGESKRERERDRESLNRRGQPEETEGNTWAKEAIFCTDRAYELFDTLLF